MSRILRERENIEVKEFKLGKIGSPSSDSVSLFSPLKIDEPSVNEKKIREERTLEKKYSFKIDKKVKDQRGITSQEESDFEKLVNDEVNRRLEKIVSNAKEDGFLDGIEKGKLESILKLRENVESFSQELKEITDSLIKEKEELLLSHEHKIYGLIKNLTKWFTLKEVSEEGYLKRLFEKLIHEVNARSNLIIRVNPESLSTFPEIVESVEAELGKLTNSRIEVKKDLSHPGIIIESENSIVDGSLEAQFEMLDSIFEKVANSSGQVRDEA